MGVVEIREGGGGEGTRGGRIRNGNGNENGGGILDETALETV